MVAEVLNQLVTVKLSAELVVEVLVVSHNGVGISIRVGVLVQNLEVVARHVVKSARRVPNNGRLLVVSTYVLRFQASELGWNGTEFNGQRKLGLVSSSVDVGSSNAESL